MALRIRRPALRSKIPALLCCSGRSMTPLSILDLSPITEGSTAAQSFRVVTDEGVNTPQSVDAGRFVVELRVAPSLPMRFIAVRLAQSGERSATQQQIPASKHEHAKPPDWPGGIEIFRRRGNL